MAPSPAEPEIGVVETHISTVLLLGDRAYKRKKAVKLPFLDYSTRAARLQACVDEVALNRRLAPDVYLGVTDVIGEDGLPTDHLVVMRRMPEARRLADLVAHGEDVDAGLREVARRIAVLHAGARRSSEISAAGSPQQVRRLWTDNLKELRPYAGAVLDPAQFERVAVLALDYLAGRRRLLRKRVRDGRIVDGHGDLLAADIYLLDDGPRILDCLEFDPRLRYGDVLLDVAFLAMDLERLGAPHLAVRFLDWYAEFSGETHPSSLADFYIAYRALVRAKVACLSQDAPEARELLALAERHLEQAEPRLVLVGGLPGSGKSTLGHALARRTGMALLASDEVRHEVLGPDVEPDRYGEGSYSRPRVARVYRELRRRAGILLAAGESVVLEATWRDPAERAAATVLAGSTSSRLVELSCEVPPGIAAARIARRSAVGDGLSDATVEIGARMAGEAVDWPSALHLDTRLPEGEVAAQALAEIRTRSASRP